jgi:16S rRNA (guanine(527)-N(7))-methyltransferase RsmG
VGKSPADSDDIGRFRSTLEATVESFGLEPLTIKQLDRLVEHYAMVCKWNRHINLTRITKPDQSARLHYAESLFGGLFIGEARTLLDLGSGPGFPGVPLAVKRSDLLVTALEGSQKKALFLNEVKEALDLSNFSVVRARIEDFDWKTYDLLTSRALDRAEETLGSVAARLRPAQRLMLYCTPDLVEQLASEPPGGYATEVHRIPQSESRVVALLSKS